MKKSIHTFHVRDVDSEYGRIYFPARIDVYDDDTIRICIADGALSEIAADAVETHRLGLDGRIEELKRTLEERDDEGRDDE